MHGQKNIKPSFSLFLTVTQQPNSGLSSLIVESSIRHTTPGRTPLDG